MKGSTMYEDDGDEPLVQPNITNMTVLNVMEYSCLQNFDTVACVRSCILAVLAIFTSILCVVKIVQLHLAHHPSCHQYVIFYAAALECATGGIHWIFWNVTQLDFLLQYMKLLQVLIMCHYYITLAIRALRKENLADRFMYPFLCIAVLYFTIITSLGIFNTEPTHVECIAPYWLALSGAELLVVQLFSVSGFYITRRLNEISTLGSVRWSQKRDLWCIVIVFELSALSTFVYDLTLQILGDRESGCSAIFSHQQVIYSPLLVSLMVIKLLVPIWVMLLVFQPHVTASEKDDFFPGYSEDVTYGSIFSDDQTYRQLYQPGDSFSYTSPTPSPSGSPSMYDASLPYAYINPALTRSGLQTIAEENNDDGQIQKKSVKTNRAVSPLAESARPIRTQGQFQRGKFITRLVTKSATAVGDNF
ncbi:uncharacterized protein LOC131942190 [Physella acuta]|uniref:uncharacterized protein LOC131942190 n=1 Tax=Physella acuta TaxID=109671 RepID=UPI0027DD807E|nr:uncharacterized protein LOC131942190 [Physella acuta]XP_059157904.1 uncharacterized protein LOC131942190 [Physella acuta]XP_059157905.1 uncharacterized protein LOC131942190 [Physella acuta]XP_059157906.1 uncharacterized protein LOC131942190 [Physella acuta]